jgi:hypothetical protein
MLKAQLNKSNPISVEKICEMVRDHNQGTKAIAYLQHYEHPTQYESFVTVFYKDGSQSMIYAFHSSEGNFKTRLRMKFIDALGYDDGSKAYYAIDRAKIKPPKAREFLRMRDYHFNPEMKNYFE